MKLVKGGINNRTSNCMTGFKMVAHIPYSLTAPKFYALASEVATMHLLRPSGLPDPEVCDYCPSSDNAAKTEYILMSL